MAEARTVDRYKITMKLKLRRQFLPKLLALWSLLYILWPALALASTYGSGSYGECTYQNGCLQVEHKSFFEKYALIIFAVLFVFALFWLIMLLLRRRKKD